MAVSFMTLWSLWAFLLLVLFLKSAFAHQAEAVFRRDYRTIWLNLFRLWLQYEICYFPFVEYFVSYGSVF